MPLRPSPPEPGPAAEAGLGTQPEGGGAGGASPPTPPEPRGHRGTAIKDHSGPVSWWRLRSWKKDLDVLARVHRGLRALPDEPSASGHPNGSSRADVSPPDPAIATIRDTFAAVAA